MTWQVVGIFEAAAASPSRRYGATPRFCRASISRGNTYQSVYLRLETHRQPAATQGRAHHRSAAQRHRRCASRTTSRSSRRSCRPVIRYLGFGIACLMGLGAVFGAVNTMYSAVAARTREIATLRALGFGSWPVVVLRAD